MKSQPKQFTVTAAAGTPAPISAIDLWVYSVLIEPLSTNASAVTWGDSSGQLGAIPVQIPQGGQLQKFNLKDVYFKPVGNNEGVLVSCMIAK